MKFFKSLFASSDVFALSSASVQSFAEKWPQIKAYYEILAKTFNASVKGNLKIIKSESAIFPKGPGSLQVGYSP